MRATLRHVAPMIAAAAIILAAVAALAAGSGGEPPRTRAGASGSSLAPRTPTRAGGRTAAAFVDSVGVNVHMSYSDTPYRAARLVVEELARLGVRHVRDGLRPGLPDQYAALRALARRGIRSTLILGDPAGRFGRLEPLLATVRRDLLGAVEAVEGANEYDASGDPRWAANLRRHQRRLYRAVKREPRTRSLRVLGPSVTHADSPALLGDLSRWMDVGNIHPYPGGQPPDGRRIAEELAKAARVSATRPVIATETGYHNAVASTDGHAGVSEDEAATYVPRLYLEHFRAGIRRTFLYELLDERPDPSRTDIQSDFGLLRNDLSEKPAYASLRNLLSILRDDSRARTPPARLRYRAGGDRSALQRLTLTKRDGSRYLALWRDVPAADGARRGESPGARPVVLRLTGAGRRIEVYEPRWSAKPTVRLRHGRRVALSVGADVVVVRVSRPGIR